MFESFNFLKPHRRHQLMPIFFTLVFSAALAPQILSRQLTLEQAIEIAVNKTPRGYIIRGRSEVAEQNYRAKKINFYVPEISINGSLPAYSVDESYRFFGGSSQKELYKTKELSFRTFVELKQSLITGGALTITANLTDNDDQYPDTRRLDLSGNPITGDAFVTEKSRRGFFDFRLTQPLFRPSSAKHDLDVRKADKEIAAFARIQEQAGLEKDVTTAYLDLLQAKLKASIYADKLESARLKAGIDSSKFSDGVVSEEELLTSTSAMLDAELERFEFQ
ncbi:MAG: TolC family protein, partial [candidate division Zixibacteria bacterium]|nr:TolC family protein [candidate division Zixibacteria bacterium]